jgi:hypothetical protein
MTIDNNEWERRFKAHLIARSGVTEEGAQATFDAVPIEEWREGEAEPEEAAEDEMENWDDDGNGEPA